MDFRKTRNLHPVKPRDLRAFGITKNSVIIEWSGDKGDVLLNDIVIAEAVASPYIIENLDSNTEYTVKVVNRGGESNTVTFKTKEITYKEVKITCDFKEKITGSEAENPHSAFYIWQSASIQLPSAAWIELGSTASSNYSRIASLDDTVQSISTAMTANAHIAQMMFKFNIIEAIERYDSNYFNYRGATTLAEKVAVAKKEMTSYVVSIYGYGSGVSGNELNFKLFNVTNNSWVGNQQSIENEMKQLKYSQKQNTNNLYLSENGYIYSLAYAAPSDATTASSVNIDYASLELTFLVEDTRKKVVLPEEFSWKDSGIEIYKDDKGVISADIDLSEYDTKKDGTTYYLAVNGSNSNDGLTPQTAFKNLNTALNQSDCAEVIVSAGIYIRTQGQYNVPFPRDIIIKAAGDGDVIFSVHDSLSWSLVADKQYTYQATRSNVASVYDISNVDENGDYSALTIVSSIDEVEATENSYFTDSSIVYVHAKNNATVSNNNIRVYLSTNNIVVGSNSAADKICLENINIEGGSRPVLVDTGRVETTFVMKNCKLKYGSTDNSLSSLGAKTICVSCEVSGSMKDGFNYHAKNGLIPYAIEISCTGRDNGRDGADQHNGSTMHDGGKIIRVNCEYFENSGPNMIDVNEATESYNVGVYAHDSTATADTISNSDFKNSNVGAATMWLDTCKSEGSSYSLVTAAGSKTYLANTVFDQDKVMTEEGAEVIQYETEYE